MRQEPTSNGPGWRCAAALIGLISVLTALAVAPGAFSANTPVTGAAFTTVNENDPPDGDGPGHCKNGNPGINCNIYDGKEFVWLNGGPSVAYVGDGDYFFAVLEPGGQHDPNDGGASNLSDIDPAGGQGVTGGGDLYTNRIFSVAGGLVTYGGTHDFNDNKIRLMPYDDTSNPGGVYIMAICSLDEGYPVTPARCKYDAFKIREGVVEFPEDLTVTKSVFPSLDHEFSWSIEKTALNCTVATPCNLNGGGSAVINYKVKAIHDAGVDTNWAAEGIITVVNPNGSDVTGVDVTDSVDNGGTCVVDDTLDPANDHTNATIPGNGSADFHYVCTWGSDPTSADGLNTASACWEAQDLTDPAGTLAANCATFDAPFMFEDPTLIDNCANVTDTFNGGSANQLGYVCAFNDPAPTNVNTSSLAGFNLVYLADTPSAGAGTFKFTYQRTIAFNPALVPSCANYSNQADFADNSNPQQTGSATATVRICHFAGRLTPGYWKNHLAPAGSAYCNRAPSGTGCSANGPWTSLYLPQSLGSYPVNTILKAANVWVVMNCSNTGSSSSSTKTQRNNALGCLAGHLLAAKLNVANGSNPCINATIAAADAFLVSIGYAGPGSYTITQGQRNTAISLKNSLDAYNNGGFC